MNEVNSDKVNLVRKDLEDCFDLQESLPKRSRSKAEKMSPKNDLKDSVDLQESLPKRSRVHAAEETVRKRRKKVRKWLRKKGARSAKCRVRKCLRTKPEAPFNSTQFIMGEHDTLNDSDLSTGRYRRHRDSSFSLESEEPEEEPCSSEEEEDEEFLTRQFWSAYEEFNAERLDAMSKSQLVQEYFALEERLTALERELKEARQRDQRRIREPSPVEGEEMAEDIPGEVPVDAETAAKIEIFRSEIQNLESENERLRQENSALLRSSSCRCSSPSSSGSSSSSSSSSSSAGDDEESAPDPRDAMKTAVAAASGYGDSLFQIPPLRAKGGTGLEDFRDMDSGIATSEGISSASSGDDLRTEESVFRSNRGNAISDPT